MPQYMLMARYEPEVMREIVADPEALSKRDQNAFGFYGAVGGTVVDWWFLRGAKYDFAVIVDFPDAEAAHAAVMVGWSSGAFRDGEVFALATQEEMNGTLEKVADAAAAFFPPGEEPSAE